MTREDIERIERRLEGVAEGQLRAAHNRACAANPGMHPLRARIAGRGLLEVYAPLPGMQAALCTFAAQEAAFSHAPMPRVLELFYCRRGRIGWSMCAGEAVYLGPGEASVHGAVCCAESAMLFPLGHAEGFMLCADMDALSARCPEALRLAGLDAQQLAARFLCGGPTVLPASPAMDALFAPLFDAPPERRAGLVMLKAQEALLYLCDLRAPEAAAPVNSAQAALIRRIHAELTEHLDTRTTIAALSRRYLINTSALKAAFKAVYGQPIAAYMKEYRVREAMRLLRETDESIARIAERVGYASQGKFTQAFRDVTGELPTAYRRGGRG